MGSDRCIYVDFDDVLCETAREMTGLARREFSRTVSFEDIAHFDLSRSFRLGPREYERFMDIVHTEDFLAALPALPGCREVLTRWSRDGYRIFVVTGRPPASYEMSRHWLDAHGIPYARLIFVDKYRRAHRAPQGVDAVSMADLMRVNFDFAVEDAPEMIRTLARHAAYPILLMDRPWNRDIKESHRIKRCGGWSEIGDAHPGHGLS